MAKYLVGITFPDDRFIGFDGQTWHGSPGAETLAETANALSRTYSYSPAHGSFGRALALMIAEKMGGKVVVPPDGPGSEKEPEAGVVF